MAAMATATVRGGEKWNLWILLTGSMGGRVSVVLSCDMSIAVKHISSSVHEGIPESRGIYIVPGNPVTRGIQ